MGAKVAAAPGPGAVAGAETASRPVIRAERRGEGVDQAIASLAEAQHGIVSRGQLLDLGLGRRAIGHRLASGRLHPIHRGVYAVGHRVLSREGRWIAAVLAGGRSAALSHRSAAALWGMRQTAGEQIDVIAARTRHSRPGLRVHGGALAPDEVTVAGGITVTTPARTLIDLARVMGAPQLERALNEAEVLRLTDAASLAELVARHRGRRGVAALRRLLDAGLAGTTVTRSELEDRFLAFLDHAGLPRPEVNALLELAGGRVEADCVWRESRVVIELDGYASHSTRQAFERDRARDRALQVAGWRVIRVTWRHLQEEPAVVASELATLLSARDCR